MGKLLPAEWESALSVGYMISNFKSFASRAGFGDLFGHVGLEISLTAPFATVMAAILRKKRYSRKETRPFLTSCRKCAMYAVKISMVCHSLFPEMAVLFLVDKIGGSGMLKK